MTDTTNNLIPADALDGGFDDARAGRPRFAPNYTPLTGVRILRSRLYADEGGVATVTFGGTLDETALWLEAGGSGRLSVYAEVTRNTDSNPAPVQTTLKIAVVPTGKRVPEDARRIGSKRGMHAYLLDATVGVVPQAADLDGLADATTDDPQPRPLSD